MRDLSKKRAADNKYWKARRKRERAAKDERVVAAAKMPGKTPEEIVEAVDALVGKGDETIQSHGTRPMPGPNSLGLVIESKGDTGPADIGGIMVSSKHAGIIGVDSAIFVSDPPSIFVSDKDKRIADKYISDPNKPKSRAKTNPQSQEIIPAPAAKLPTTFEPDAARGTIELGMDMIETLKRLKDWPRAEETAQRLVSYISETVAWWDANVRKPGGDRQSIHAGAELMLSVADAEVALNYKQPKISKWRSRLADPDQFAIDILGQAYRDAMRGEEDSQLVQQSKTQEHYTPVRYITAVRETMGEIDLDPASCAKANKTVKALRFYDAVQDGLDPKKPWEGRVFLNPPYGGLAGKFIERLYHEYDWGHVTEAVALVNAHSTDADWFQVLWNARLFCFTDHRIDFDNGLAKGSGSTHGSAFFYFGPATHSARFVEQFRGFGRIGSIID